MEILKPGTIINQIKNSVDEFNSTLHVTKDDDRMDTYRKKHPAWRMEGQRAGGDPERDPHTPPRALARGWGAAQATLGEAGEAPGQDTGCPAPEQVSKRKHGALHSTLPQGNALTNSGQEDTAKAPAELESRS